MIAGIRMELQKVITLRNTYAPIHRRLPAEILCEIFLQLRSLFVLPVHGPPNAIPAHAWITVTHVCRQWRDIALNSPTLWTSISCKQPDCINAFIERSRQAPLDITRDHLDRKNAAGALGYLLRERNRWRTFECTVPILEWNDIDDAPQLEELRLVGALRTPPMSTPTPPSFPSLRLHRVGLVSMPYSFMENLLKRDSITNLSLENVIPRQTLATWLDVLSLLPALEELKLVNVFQSPAQPPSSRARHISLPKLRYLRLTEMDGGSAVPAFLDMTTLPPTTQLSLAGRVPSGIYGNLRHLLETIRRGLVGRAIGAEPPREIQACRVAHVRHLHADLLFVEFWTRPVSILAFFSWEHNSRPDISLKCMGDLPRTAQIVIDTLPLSKLRLLHFSGTMSDIIKQDQINKLQSVRELCVEHGIPARFIPRGGQEADLRGGHEADLLCPSKVEGTPLPFPNLEYLALRAVRWHRHPPGRPGTCSDDIVFDVRRVLQRRKAARLSLKRLNLYGGINMYAEEVRALVREGLVDTVEEYDGGRFTHCPACQVSDVPRMSYRA